jgi:hypothetical protein
MRGIRTTFSTTPVSGLATPMINERTSTANERVSNTRTTRIRTTIFSPYSSPPRPPGDHPGCQGSNKTRVDTETSGWRQPASPPGSLVALPAPPPPGAAWPGLALAPVARPLLRADVPTSVVVGVTQIPKFTGRDQPAAPGTHDPSGFHAPLPAGAETPMLLAVPLTCAGRLTGPVALAPAGAGSGLDELAAARLETNSRAHGPPSVASARAAMASRHRRALLHRPIDGSARRTAACGRGGCGRGPRRQLCGCRCRCVDTTRAGPDGTRRSRGASTSCLSARTAKRVRRRWHRTVALAAVAEPSEAPPVDTAAQVTGGGGPWRATAARTSLGWVSL